MGKFNWAALATIILVVVTAVYAYFNWRMVRAISTQTKLLQSPVLGIEIVSMKISELGRNLRRGMSVRWKVTNGGSSTAIDVLVDAEIVLNQATLDGHKVIPSRIDPKQLAFLPTTAEPLSDRSLFGKQLVSTLLEDMRKCRLLNTNKAEEYSKQGLHCGRDTYYPRIRIFAYYKNNLEVCFRTTYDIGIFALPHGDCDFHCLDDVPEDVRPEIGTCGVIGIDVLEDCGDACPFTTAIPDEAKELKVCEVQPPAIEVKRISEKQMKKELEQRNLTRRLGGHSH